MNTFTNRVKQVLAESTKHNKTPADFNTKEAVLRQLAASPHLKPVLSGGWKLDSNLTDTFIGVYSPDKSKFNVVLKNVFDRDGWEHERTIEQLAKEAAAVINKYKASLPAGRSTGAVGRFEVTRPPKHDPSYETRVIVKANDKDSDMLKSKFHNARDKIKVRTMKRKDGFMVYIDTPDSKVTDRIIDEIGKL